MAIQPTSVPVNFSANLSGEANPSNNQSCNIHPDWLYTESVYILVISVLGIVGNVFVLLVFCLHKKACTVAEIYLSNLAAADLILTSCLPFWAVYVAKAYDWIFGSVLCRLVNTAIKMNTYCSIYFLVLVSIDRYVALVHPMSHGRMRRPKYAKLSSLLVWSFGLLMSVPTLIYRKVKYDHGTNKTYCSLDYPNNTVQLICDVILIIFSFIIPISIISYCTVKIIQVVRNQTIKRLNIEKTENKATLLVLAVLLAFLICWVPYHLVTVLEMLQLDAILEGCDFRNSLYICMQIFTYLAYFNSVLNPILYVIVGKNFQEKVCELFKGGMCHTGLQEHQWSGRSATSTEREVITSEHR
ncbi:hypothetical protein LDENG_00265620 [Lucifuga dentata]|nr:hypothetical protein LDENG_00265620 [Lucifuga dentata]